MENGRSDLDKLAVAADQKSKEEKYWVDKFSGEFIKSSFPYDFNPDGTTGYNPDSIQFQLTGQTYSRLMEIINRSDVRLFIVLVSAVTALLNKYTSHKDIAVGAPVYKQEIDARFINTVLALRNPVEHRYSFKELLLVVGKGLSGAIDNQNYPFETLMNQLKIPFSPELDYPLFDTAILLENIHSKKYLKNIKCNTVFTFENTGENINGVVEYNASRYERTTIERIVSHFERLLNQVIQDVDMKLEDIELLSGTEKEQFIFDFNDTAAAVPEDATIHRLFEQQAEKKPGNVAVVHGEREMTYRELNDKSNQLARHLIARGVGPADIVPIMVERSLDMLVGILGILKAGGAYLPISPELPMARKMFMLRDSNARHLLAQRSLIEDNRDLTGSLSPGQIIHLDDPAIYSGDNEKPGLPVVVPPENPVYIIYTSGSTGQPKGVVLEHRGVINYIHWAAGQYVRNEKAAFPLYTSFSFDLTVTSIFTPLITGNAVVIYSGDEREFFIKNVIEEDRVEVVKVTPSHMKLIREVMTEGCQSSIKRFIVGGEDLSSRLANDIHRMFSSNVEIYNEYGPTETVVGSMIYQFDPGKDTGESVSIGTPISNTQIYLLDENLKPVPPGVNGELFISGHGVAKGYLNRPELTHEKFIDNPFIPGQKMYATGDLGRREQDGNLSFLGRRDEQVKIRGFRVELGEIENKIRNFNRTGDTEAPGAKAINQLPDRTGVVRCPKCLLPGDFPGVQFGGNGVCHVCNEYENKYKEHLDKYFKESDDFYNLVEEIKEKTPTSDQYDCLLLFSGGKDSTYVLYRLKELGLKVLAFTFDNGYISDAAFQNIRRTTSILNVELVVGNTDHMNSVFIESLKTNHNVCHGCWHALNTMAIKIAHERGINVVVSGLSRGQIFDMRLEGLYRAGIFNEGEIEEKLLSFRKAFHSKDNKFFRLGRVELEEKAVGDIRFVDFFRYFNITTPEIKRYLIEKGWVQPKDTGFCSSNCLINDVGIYMYLKEEGHHFYAAPLSWDIRLGQLSREDGLKEMGFRTDLGEVGRILDEIGFYTPPTIKDVVVIDREEDNGSKYLCAYIVPETEITLSETEMREYLLRELPDYMVPSHFIQVDQIPLGASGKVDRKVLLELEGSRLQMSVDFVEPRDEKEALIANLCKEVFKLEKIGIYDNFFNLGATSFSIIQLNNKLQEVLKKDIPVLTMFEYPTIASFLEYMEEDTSDSSGTPEEEEEWVASRKEGQNKFRKLRNKRVSEEDF